MSSEKERIVALAEPVAAELGLEVLDVELSGNAARRVVRIFLDSAEGGVAGDGQDGPAAPTRVTLADCEAVSRRLGDVLEAHEQGGDADADGVLGERYVLEVSSPGVNRPLVKPTHFRRVVGQRVRLKLAAGHGAHGKETVLGRLDRIDEDGVLTVVVDGGEPRRIRPVEIDKANLEFEFPDKARPGKRRPRREARR